MAVKPVVYNTKDSMTDALSKMCLVRWNALQLNDTGVPIYLPGFHLCAFQVLGTTGASMNSAMQATFDPADTTNFMNYLTQNNNLGIANTTSSVWYGSWFRPTVSGGDGTTLLDFIAIFTRGD